MIQNLVVGAGISGATIARKIAEDMNEQVLVIDSKDHIAGNIYDYQDQNNITVHKYGSHIFHTNLDHVWQFITRFTDFNNYRHRVLVSIDDIETSIPFNLTTLYDVFPHDQASRLELKLLSRFKEGQKVPILEFQKQEDADLKFLADFIYEKIFLHYTEKQWGVKPDEIDKSVTARVPVLISHDTHYFQDRYQGIPLNGYTKTVQNILNHPNITVRLNTPFQQLTEKYQRLFYTGPIDEFFNYRFGELGYRSLIFKFEEHNCEFYQSNSVINHPGLEEKFTRIHEYKYYLNEKSSKTTIAKEYPAPFRRGENDRYYPILNPINQDLYQKYLSETSQLNHTYFLGRLGDYKYYDIDKAIDRALSLFKSIQNTRV